MKHSDIRQNLSAYMDGSVTPEEKAIIDEHLESCPECRVALEELKKTAACIRELEEVEPPAWLAPKIMEKAREEAETKRGIFSRLFSPFPVKLSLEAAALVLVTVTGYLVFRVAQPEMDIVGTAEKKETGKAAPMAEKPPAPAAPSLKKQARKEMAAGKREEKAVSPVPPAPSALNQAPAPGEKEAPAPAPETGFAPAPSAKSAPRVFDFPDMAGRKEPESASSMQAERSMRASGMADEAKEEAQGGSIVLHTAKKAKKATKGNVETGISFVLRTDKGPSVAGDLESLVVRLGGRVVKRGMSGENPIISILIEERKLDTLRKKLRSFGEVTGSGMNYEADDRTGDTAVTIEIEQE